MNNEPLRPDPDRLLEQTAAPHRGAEEKFSSVPAQASERPGRCWRSPSDCRRKGLDIVVGVVKPRAEDTAAMLEGLAVLPLKRQAYRGRHISEFDLDAALARRPAPDLNGRTGAQ